MTERKITREEPMHTTALPEDDPMHTTEDVAARYKVTPNTVAIWRFRGIGPKFVKLSRRCVRYRESALRKHEASCEVA